MRLLLEKSILLYSTDILNKISLQNFSTILESCVFNSMVSSSELSKLFEIAVSKVKYSQNPFESLSNLLLAFSYFCKINRAKPEQVMPSLILISKAWIEII
jgi:hypothetical protein